MLTRSSRLALAATLLLGPGLWQSAQAAAQDSALPSPQAFSTAPPVVPHPEASPEASPEVISLPDLLDSDSPPPTPVPTPTPVPSPAQELSWLEKDELPFDFFLYTTGGWMRPDFNALNQKLSEQNFQPFALDQFSLGGGMQLGFGSLLTEFQGAVNLSLPAVNSEYITSQSNGFGLFNLGYILRPTRDLRIYPLVGIGMGFVDLQFTQRNTVMDFDSFLKAPGRQGQISSFALLLNAGLGLDYHFRMVEDIGFRLGLRGGWYWTPILGNFWQVSNLFSNSDSNNSALAVPGGPNVGMTGPYVQVLLGF